MVNDDLILSPADHARLADLVEGRGEVGAAEALRLSRTSVLRLLSKRPVRYATISLARIGLAAKGV